MPMMNLFLISYTTSLHSINVGVYFFVVFFFLPSFISFEAVFQLRFNFLLVVLIVRLLVFVRTLAQLMLMSHSKNTMHNPSVRRIESSSITYRSQFINKHVRAINNCNYIDIHNEIPLISF